MLEGAKGVVLFIAPQYQAIRMQYKLCVGADINLLCDNSYTALQYAILREHPLKIVRILIKGGADTEIHSSYGFTALHHAAMMNLEDATLLLLRHGANIHAGAAHIGTPLHVAAGRNHVATIQHLLRHGAKVNVRTEDGVSALDLAAQNGCEESVKALIEGGADIEAADPKGLSALDIATQENQESVAQLLRAAKGFRIQWGKSGELELVKR